MLESRTCRKRLLFFNSNHSNPSLFVPAAASILLPPFHRLLCKSIHHGSYLKEEDFFCIKDVHSQEILAFMVDPSPVLQRTPLAVELTELQRVSAFIHLIRPSVFPRTGIGTALASRLVDSGSFSTHSVTRRSHHRHATRSPGPFLWNRTGIGTPHRAFPLVTDLIAISPCPLPESRPLPSKTISSQPTIPEACSGFSSSRSTARHRIDAWWIWRCLAGALCHSPPLRVPKCRMDRRHLRGRFAAKAVLPFMTTLFSDLSSLCRNLGQAQISMKYISLLFISICLASLDWLEDRDKFFADDSVHRFKLKLWFCLWFMLLACTIYPFLLGPKFYKIANSFFTQVSTFFTTAALVKTLLLFGEKQRSPPASPKSASLRMFLDKRCSGNLVLDLIYHGGISSNLDTPMWLYLCVNWIVYVFVVLSFSSGIVCGAVLLLARSSMTTPLNQIWSSSTGCRTLLGVSIFVKPILFSSVITVRKVILSLLVVAFFASLAVTMFVRVYQPAVTAFISLHCNRLFWF